MKKFLAIFMASVMTLSLCSCWGGRSGTDISTDSTVEDVSKDVLEEAEDEGGKETLEDKLEK